MRIEATLDDRRLAEFNRRHWLAMGVAAEDFAPDWLERTLSFIAEGRSARSFVGFVALDGEQAIGSACCQVSEQRFPHLFGPQGSSRGYIWGVFVEPHYRGAGTGGRLVEHCVDHLRRVGCDRVDLHAGDRSRMLYERLGFRATDELTIRLPSGRG
jgi:ribosomal protein S18 acetylase RimI-like enzyme